ncbi:MAG TPA: Rap1a/Tai family immunity protein, partial [Rhodopila sp.]|nr:Rap1a/Tai family immunity protein [Rhodopila sp.]
MRWTSWLMTAAVTAAWPVGAMAVGTVAVTQDNFHARTTGDLVALCDAPASDPMRVAAIHFCEGFMVGAYQYHEAERMGPKGQRLFCLPTSGVTLDQAIGMFV